jgi:Fe2+ transport system protein B
MTLAFVLEQVKKVQPLQPVQPVHTVDPYFTAGYFIGIVLFFVVMVLIFKFVGRWGWFGVLIRMGVAGLVAFRVMSLIASAHSFA